MTYRTEIDRAIDEEIREARHAERMRILAVVGALPCENWTDPPTAGRLVQQMILRELRELL